MKQNRQRPSAPDFFAFAQQLIDEFVLDKRYGTSQTYTKAVSSFKAFLQTDPARKAEDTVRLPIDAIDDNLIGRYNRHLAWRGIVRNSISFYNRVLRAIYNKAVRQYRIPDRHPFADVYTGVDRTRNRAVSENAIARLVTLDLSRDKALETARDLFVFSYLTRGMTFVDMAYLKKSDIRGDRITYIRRKTGTRMEVRIEPQTRKKATHLQTIHSKQ